VRNDDAFVRSVLDGLFVRSVSVRVFVVWKLFGSCLCLEAVCACPVVRVVCVRPCVVFVCVCLAGFDFVFWQGFQCFDFGFMSFDGYLLSAILAYSLGGVL
jgi:hypothetical protein